MLFSFDITCDMFSDQMSNAVLVIKLLINVWHVKQFLPGGQTFPLKTKSKKRPSFNVKEHLKVNQTHWTFNQNIIHM